MLSRLWNRGFRKSCVSGGVGFEDLGSAPQGAWVLLRLGVKKSGATILGVGQGFGLFWIWTLKSQSVGF